MASGGRCKINQFSKKWSVFCVPGLKDVEKLGLTVFHAGTTFKDDKLVTSGGRVLAVMATESNFEMAASVAQKGASLVKFEGAQYRTDIGWRVVNRLV